MTSQAALKLAWLGLLLLMLVSIVSALATANTVPESGVSSATQSITANDLKPSECASLNLQNVITSGNGGSGNDLVLGSSSADTLDGGEGDDCIVGGDGADTLTGGNGTDIILGGNGDDDLSGNGGTDDTCYGEGGTDTLDASCETQVQ